MPDAGIGSLFGKWGPRAEWLPKALKSEAAIVVLFSALNVVVGFGGNRILTEVASPFDLGQLYLYTNLALWLTLPTASGFIYMTHHWAIAREQRLTTRLMRGVWWGLGIQTLLIVLGVIGLRLVGGTVSSGPIALAIALSAIATAVAQALGPIPAAERRRTATGLLGLLGGPGRQLALATGAVVFAVASGVGFLWVQSLYLVLVAALSAMVVYAIYRATLPARAGTAESEEISLGAFTKYSLPAFGGVVVAQICASAERWGLARLEDTAATALFVQAVGLGTASVGAVGGVLTGYFYPLITQAAAKGADPVAAASVQLRRFIAFVAGSMAVACLGGLFLSRPLTPVLFGSRFAGVAPLLPWGICGAALFVLGQALTIPLYTGRDPLWPNVARVVAQAGYAATLLIYRPGIEAALAYARIYAAGQALYLVLVMFGIARLLRRRKRLAGRAEIALAKR